MRPPSSALGALWLVIALGGCGEAPTVDVVGLERQVDVLRTQAREAIEARAQSDVERDAASESRAGLIARLESAENELSDLRARVGELERPAPPPTPTAAPTPSGVAVKGIRYRVDLNDAQSKGNAAAKVTIVMFTDFQCPFCARSQATLKEVEKAYPDDVRFVAKHNPLAFHKDALAAAKAAEAAGRQGKFWEMHDRLFENPRALTSANFKRWAKELKLDVRRFEDDMNKSSIADLIKNDQAQATKLGARGVPAFFINGRFLSGAQPMSAFEELIKEEIEEADAWIASGTAPSSVYDALTEEALAEPE